MPLHQYFAAPLQRGIEVQLEFNFERIKRAPNTTLSHRFIALVPDDKKTEIVEAVYAAYFQYGEDIGQKGALLNIAARHGLDIEKLEQQLAGQAGLDQVRADMARARQLGISSTPYFIINNHCSLNGPQPIYVIRQALLQATYQLNG